MIIIILIIIIHWKNIVGIRCYLLYKNELKEGELDELEGLDKKGGIRKDI